MPDDELGMIYRRAYAEAERREIGQWFSVIFRRPLHLIRDGRGAGKVFSPASA